MMVETFGDSYRAYMARTGRVFPSIFLEVVPTDRSWTRGPRSDRYPNALQFRTIFATSDKNKRRNR